MIGRDAGKLKGFTAKGADAAAGDLADRLFLTRAFTGAEAVFTLIPPNPAVADFRAYQEKIGKNRKMNIMGSAVLGDVKLSMIATKDIAAYAAERLAKRDFTGKSVADLLGERDLPLNETAVIIGKKLGKPDLAYMTFPYEDAEKGMVAMGLTPDMSRLSIERMKSTFFLVPGSAAAGPGFFSRSARIMIQSPLWIFGSRGKREDKGRTDPCRPGRGHHNCVRSCGQERTLYPPGYFPRPRYQQRRLYDLSYTGQASSAKSIPPAERRMHVMP